MPDIKILDEVIHYDEAAVFEVNRCDFSLDFYLDAAKLGSVKRTEQGYIKGEVPVAKVGVMTYLLADGTMRREFVPAETLFNPDDMATLQMQPITDTHPPEILVDSKTIKRRRIGTTGENIKRHDEYLKVPIVITDDDGIQSVENGRHQFSPGYKCFVIKKEGIFNGIKYDAIQIKRIYNHLALCDRARGGSDLKLSLDAEELERVDGFDIITDKSKKEPQMPKITLDGIDYEAAQEVINHVRKLQTKIDADATVLNAKTADCTKLQAKVDEQKEKIDTLEKRDTKAEVAAGVREKLSLLKTAQTVLSADEFKKIDVNIDSADLKKKIILAKYPKANLDGKDSAYIDARVDSIIEEQSFDPTAINQQRQHSAPRFDSTSLDIVEKAQADSEASILSAFENFGKDTSSK